MLNKEEIGKYKQTLFDLIEDEDVYDSIKEAVKGTYEYIEQLEKQVKELSKGNHSLMQSRKKWKNRYYKEKEKSKDLQKSVDQIYEDYQDIGKMYFNLDEKQDKLIQKLEERKNKAREFVEEAKKEEDKIRRSLMGRTFKRSK